MQYAIHYIDIHKVLQAYYYHLQIASECEI